MPAAPPGRPRFARATARRPCPAARSRPRGASPSATARGSAARWRSHHAESGSRRAPQVNDDQLALGAGTLVLSQARAPTVMQQRHDTADDVGLHVAAAASAAGSDDGGLARLALTLAPDAAGEGGH